MTARHQQVADDLRRLITSGALPVGEKLAAETKLAARYRVSTPTLREALELLRAEGLVEKFQGRGNFVRRPAKRLTYPRDRNAASGKPGQSPALDVIVSSREITATGTLTSLLQVQPEAPLTEYVYVSHRGDSPQSLAHIYVPCDVAPLSQPVTSTSPWGDDIIERLAASGLQVAHSIDQVTARFPTAAEAQSLRIATRTPVLAVERTATEANGRIVAAALLVLPGDRTEIVFSTLTPIATKETA